MAVGFLILGTAIVAWRTHREHRLVVWSATLAIGLLPV